MRPAIVLAILLVPALCLPALGQTAGKAAVAGDEKRAAAQAAVGTAEAATTVADREEGFKKARQCYEVAIAEAEKALAAATTDADRRALRLQVLRTRLDLANMIFQRWLKTDLDFLEVTDRRVGDRARATELMKAALDQCHTVSAEGQKALVEIDHVSARERPAIVATYVLELRKIEREAKFSEAWVTYYYGWLLTPDFKPDKAKGERTKDESSMTPLPSSRTTRGCPTRRPRSGTPSW